MYEYMDHIKCVDCGNTKCLFYVRNYKIKSGEIRRGICGCRCQMCHREYERERFYSWKDNKNNIYLQEKI